MELQTLNLSEITYNDDGRGKITDKSISELAKSIREAGLIQPISVRRNGKKYDLIAGRRRYKAFQYLKADQIHAIVFDVNTDEVFIMQVTENMQRTDLTPLQIAHSFNEYKGKLSINEIALLLGKSKSYIQKIAVLNRLQNPFKKWLVAGLLSNEIAITIAKYSKENQKLFVDAFDAEDGFYVNNWQFNSIKNSIETNLKDAPFKLDSENWESKTKIGSCNNCKKKSSAAAELFDTKLDLCLDSKCFNTKTTAHLKSVKDKLHKAGKEYKMISLEYYTEDKNVLSAQNYEKDHKKYAKAIMRYEGLIVEGDSKQIGRVMRILLNKDIEAHRKNPKKAIAKTEILTAEFGVDKLFNSKFKNNKYRSTYDAYQIFLKGLVKEPGNPLDIHSITDLFALLLDECFNHNQLANLENMFDKKLEGYDTSEYRKKVVKAVKDLKGFHIVNLMYAMLIKQYSVAENYFVDEQGKNVMKLAAAVGFDLAKLLKETDVEYAKERDHLLERFQKNHKRKPIIEKK